ncbi:class I SAM-dependent methyltransferase [Oryzihumus leptocrescens]|uniref:Demethylmenaquinone methyltransferase/2-methoxy-6-polyprenyl-1,4-benzoquinol methylase n=1 Tax=Oryzihumus leptocrescens TaxID=297536 RepID=A0A542ZNM4_9MICO|nr:class I SAM-dependent methyltransferase [Oryzihumus leptocrescens]TQL61942.1 demethylmenaquinone methyltransferase/2-methoxy-6-polyprenyl-1,4-benzoquinol methylase [Oryzihumus leptocrescens]
MSEGRLGGQVDYYRARAGEYDDFWFRRGAYELEGPLQAQWFEDAAEAEEAVRRWVPAGAVLELACGTGIWTRVLVQRAARVTAVDASPEMIELNRHRVSGAPVDYVVADVFSWAPPKAAFDAVFMGYWHSHVPDGRLDTFWAWVRSVLRPGGRVMLVDSSPYPPGTPGDPAARAEARTLNDGRRFEVVKRYWDPGDLRAYLAGRGWQTRARTTGHGMVLLAELEALDGGGA